MRKQPGFVAQRRPVRIACVGHASLDHVFEIDRFAIRPTKTPAHRYHARTGGMAANAALAAARLGAAVRLIGRVGDDAAAAFLHQSLAAEGIEVAGLEIVRGASTSVSAVIVDAGGERQIYNHRGDAIARAHALDTRVLAGADIVLVDPRWLAGATAALRWARDSGVATILDADVAEPTALRALVPLAQWAAFSEPGLTIYAPDLSPAQALQSALRAGSALALVTRGVDGALWTRGESLIEQPAPRVHALDTTAAGDVFHGALAVARAQGRADLAAIEFACVAATLKCRRGQGAQGAPTRQELDHFIAELASSATTARR